MFGYVKPIRCKLCAEDWEQYRAAYCGLCHVLGERYGFPARFIVNYDFTFLSILLFSVQADETSLKTKRCRCVASPIRKKCVCVSHPSLEAAADASIILFWWQLQDSISDRGFIKSLPYRFLCGVFRASYRKARGKLPEFAKQVQTCIEQLQALERERVDSIDRPADTFARILENLSMLVNFEDHTVLSDLLYHLGRFIYIIDAWDDVGEDFRVQRYNPVATRFGLESETVPSEVCVEIEQTLCHSVSEIQGSFGKLHCDALHDLLENIVSFGLYSVVRQVALGEKPKKEKQIHE